MWFNIYTEGNKFCGICGWFCYYQKKKKNKAKNQDINLQPLLDDISSWCEYSGATLSVTKCKHLHICRKHSCNPNLLNNNSIIPSVDSLKILGVTFNNRFRWNTHIESIIPGLNNRLNIIKCLASTKFNCNTISILTTVHALIKSKFEYGLVIYGKAPKSLLNKLNTVLNSAIRIALGAYRTTPINNLLFESVFMSVLGIKDLLTCKLFKNIFFRDKSPLSDTTSRLIESSKFKHIRSTLNNKIENCQAFNIPINNKIMHNHSFHPLGISIRHYL